MEFDRFKLYWRVTSRLAVTVLFAVFLVIMAVLVNSEWLDGYHIFGFPLSVFIVGQVVVLGAIASMFWFIGAQDGVDNGFGANEEL
ncbi:MAG: hypothetical protein DHS20C08_21350 [Rhodomicrobium sp.]|nr:MAG: hypothetical protein DHS20C08_21350 [Rhodomicrobium sp.]